MKNAICRGIICFVVTLAAPRIVQAQGTTYLSNLGQPSDGSNAVGSDSWLAALFFTGTNSSGYMLDSLQLAITDASGNPSGFTVMLYSAFIGGGGTFPGSSLGTLDGSLNPTTAGIYTFTPASNLTLSPHTTYFIMLTAGTAVVNGAYEWSVMNTPSYNPVDKWLGAITSTSMNGSSWRPLPTYPQLDYSQYAINATPIPEPNVLGLLGLGGLTFLWHRRKAKAV
jgi:hypothetical protein